MAFRIADERVTRPASTPSPDVARTSDPRGDQDPGP